MLDIETGTKKNLNKSESQRAKAKSKRKSKQFIGATRATNHSSHTVNKLFKSYFAGEFSNKVT